MTKRFASHYLLLPEVGFIRQQVVEITDTGVVTDFFPLTEEIESVEWMPGVIALLSVKQLQQLETTGTRCMGTQAVCPYSVQYTKEMKKHKEVLYPYLFYPFDFTSMQPVAETRHRLLR